MNLKKLISCLSSSEKHELFNLLEKELSVKKRLSLNDFIEQNRKKLPSTTVSALVSYYFTEFPSLYVEDLTIRDLLMIRGIGKLGLSKIEECLLDYNIRLKYNHDNR